MWLALTKIRWSNTSPVPDVFTHRMTTTPILVNLDQVVYIEPLDDQYSLLYLHADGAEGRLSLEVQESPEQILAQIERQQSLVR